MEKKTIPVHVCVECNKCALKIVTKDSLESTE